MRVLVVYGTSEGQTQRIADFLSERLSQQGHEVTTVDAVQVHTSPDLAAFDAVIIAARVHAGLYQRKVVQFVRKNVAHLAAMPNAFLSVSMSAANLKPGDLDRAKAYVDRFILRTQWQPQRIVQVAGARLYTRHNPLIRSILRFVDGNLLDSSKDHVWTDWGALAQFALDFPKLLPRTTRASGQL